MRFKHLLLLIITLYLTSCAIKKEKQIFMNDLKEKYCKSKEYCAVGIGKTEKEADIDAKRNLASQIYSFVFSEFEKRQILKKEGNTETIKERKENVLKTFTNLSLMYIKEIKTAKIDGYYYKVISIDPYTAKKIYKKYKKIATALSYVDKIESESDISAIIGLLKDLQEEIKIKNLGDYEFFSKKYNKVFTFKSYLNFQIQNVIDSLNAVLVPKGIYLIEKVSFNPIQNVKTIIIDANNKKIIETSNDNGFIRLYKKIKYPINVYLDFSGYDLDQLLIARLYKKENPYIKIYIKTNPDNLYYRIMEDGNVKKEGVTPSIAEIKYKSYSRYEIKVFGDGYLPIRETLNLLRGYDYYFYKNVGRLKYGYLDLKVEGDAYLSIYSKTGTTILDERYRKSEFKGKVPVGTYVVTIKRKENPNKYQIVYDEIFVKEGETIKRNYFEPRDREYYFEKEGYGFGFIYTGRHTNKEIKYECISTWGCNSSVKPDFDLGGTGGVYFKKFKTHTYFGFEAGLGSLEDKNETSSSNSEPGLYVDLGVGFYFGDNAIFEIGTGIYAFSAEYNNRVYKAKLSGSGPYIGGKIGYIFQGKKKDGGFYVGLGYKRVFLSGKYYIDIVTFDFGGATFKTKSGYKYPASTRALRVINYEDD